MRSAILAATKCGLDFTLACNTETAELSEYLKDGREYGIKLAHIDFDRNPFSLKNIRARK